MTAPVRRSMRVAMWALLVWVSLFWRLGEPTFWDPDEAHYAVTTRELLTNADWLAPTYNGLPFFDKPILFHQLQALSMLATDRNELGARLVSALAAVALIGVVWWIGVVLCGEEIGGVAALLLTICPALVALARYAILDMLFTAFLFSGAAVLTVSALGRRPRLHVLGYILLALSVLTKGPVALALTGLTFLLMIAIAPDVRRSLLSLHWGVGALLVLSLSLPWFGYMWWRFGDAFLQGYLLNENLWLFSRPPYGNQPGWTFYLQIVAVSMLPWTPVLIGRLYDVCARQAVDPFELLLWGWVVVIVGFFSASQFKLDHYVFPAAPALCLLNARAWSAARGAVDRTRHLGVRTGFLLVGPILVVAGAICAVLLMTRVALPMGTWALPVIWVVLGGLLIGSGRARVNRTPWITAVAFGTLYVVALVDVVPTIERQKVIADMARWIVAHADASTRVCSYRLNRWNNSLLFYVDRPVTMSETPDHLRAIHREGQPFLCVMPQSAYDELAREGTALSVVHHREGLWATSGRALSKSSARLTTFVVVSDRPSFRSSGSAVIIVRRRVIRDSTPVYPGALSNLVERAYRFVDSCGHIRRLGGVV